MVQSKMVAKQECNQKWLQSQNAIKNGCKKCIVSIQFVREVEKMKNYVSLIMDIEKSRTYATEDRIELQKYMSYCIEKLNELFDENIEHDVTFSAGDELQGLFIDTTAAVMYFRLFELLLKPVKLRAGIGVGEWTVKIDNGSSTQQDGPAYHRARRAIEEVYSNTLHNVKICSSNDDVMANHLINASRVLKNQQIYMQNIVLVILELLCPFVKRETKVDKYQIVSELLKIKFEYQIGRMQYFYSRNEKFLESQRMHFSEFSFLRPIYIDGNIEEVEEHIIVKNVSSVISEILGCSRQNVDSILKRGNSYKIRELDYMALQYIERMYRE